LEIEQQELNSYLANPSKLPISVYLGQQWIQLILISMDTAVAKPKDYGIILISRHNMQVEMRNHLSGCFFISLY